MFRRKHNSHGKQDHHAENQEEKIEELRAEIGPLEGRSLKYCTDECLRRYLVARKWDVAKSKKMLEETVEWRSSYKPEEIRWREVAEEGETGKAYRADFHDREGRTVIVMRPAKQNTSSQENQLRHLVYLLENAIINLPEKQEDMMWLIDFTGWSLSNAVPIKQAREIANILQNHYPERLGFAFLYNPPRIFEAFWKVVKYFLDPKTFQKVKFVYPKNQESMEVMSEFFDLDVLTAEFGGRNKTEYEHEAFSKMMEEDDVKTARFWDLQQQASTAV
ncbi:CRAL-TRIO domain-containing protein C23B6.04c-like [Zingiber officinale]|uniref:CRAL-TRIO domain-containing protein n=1 Tax=Zingiber officinale TaxID=94328 RepID=A0A8J5KRL0_ZINOF|nr:CRAL-TRIO domain-containing protein C23B6.04c-like [Zingiber officinale]KAG6486470.1 hypothetical protein ZIOFF_055046 [Zingiber officinale]